MEYDLVVIGGGPAGYSGAIRAAKLGARVALVEENKLGGTCLNCGCIPTKALLHSAEIFHNRHEWAELGIVAENISLDENKLFERKDKIVSTLRAGVESLIRANKIDLYSARGKIIDKNTVLAGNVSINAKNILIATGSRPAGFDPSRPIEGIENAFNSDDVLASPILGNNIVIVGAGVIGVEFASYFSSINKSVTLIAAGDRIIKMMSRDMSLQLAATLKKAGVKIVTGAKIIKVSKSRIEFEAAGKFQAIECDQVISALGRRANIEDIGLENVNISAEKFIEVDKDMRTSVPNIYACGDVIGKVQLAHYAAASSVTAVESMLSRSHSMNLDVVPSCIYTRPEIAVVGKREDEVEGARVGKFMMGANGKSIIEGVNRGFVKIIASGDVIVGAEIFAVRATDIIGELALAISSGLTVSEVARVIHAHPTIYEAVGEALEDIHGLATHLMPR